MRLDNDSVFHRKEEHHHHHHGTIDANKTKRRGRGRGRAKPPIILLYMMITWAELESRRHVCQTAARHGTAGENVQAAGR